MYWIVCYDIPDDKRRTKVHKLLKGYGRRAQYSIFECEITLDKLKRLEKQLQRLINEQEDDVRIYPLNQADLKRVRFLGIALLHRSQGHYLV